MIDASRGGSSSRAGRTPTLRHQTAIICGEMRRLSTRRGFERETALRGGSRAQPDRKRVDAVVRASMGRDGDSGGAVAAGLVARDPAVA
jgi:hypothetical protein